MNNTTPSPPKFKAGLIIAGIGFFLFSLFLCGILGLSDDLHCFRPNPTQVNCEIQQKLWGIYTFDKIETYPNVQTVSLEQDCSQSINANQQTCIKVIILQTNTESKRLQTNFGNNQSQQQRFQQIETFLVNTNTAELTISTLNWSLSLITLACTFIPSIIASIFFILTGLIGGTSQPQTTIPDNKLTEIP